MLIQLFCFLGTLIFLNKISKSQDGEKSSCVGSDLAAVRVPK